MNVATIAGQANCPTVKGHGSLTRCLLWRCRVPEPPAPPPDWSWTPARDFHPGSGWWSDRSLSGCPEHRVVTLVTTYSCTNKTSPCGLKQPSSFKKKNTQNFRQSTWNLKVFCILQFCFFPPGTDMEKSMLAVLICTCELTTIILPSEVTMATVPESHGQGKYRINRKNRIRFYRYVVLRARLNIKTNTSRGSKAKLLSVLSFIQLAR